MLATAPDADRKGKREIHVADQPGEIRTMHGSHQVADVLLLENTYFPRGLQLIAGEGIRKFGDLTTKVLRENEIPIEDEEVCFDVQKPECYIAVAERWKRMRHGMNIPKRGTEGNLFVL